MKNFSHWGRLYFIYFAPSQPSPFITISLFYIKIFLHYGTKLGYQYKLIMDIKGL